MVKRKSCASQGGPSGLPWLGSLILLALSFFAVPAAFCDDTGWVLTQKSTKLGDQYVYISAAGCKLVNPKVGFALVTRAPNWDITLYNDSTKVFYATTLEKWKHDMESRGLTAGDILKGSWKKSGTANIAGTGATEYTMGANSGTYLDGTGKKKMTQVEGAHYWVADDIKVPATLVDLIAIAYGLPKSTKVPLRLKIMDKHHGDTELLDTYRLQTAPIPVSYFTCPQGYKRVSSDAEVMMNDEQKSILQEMSKELGSSPDAPPSPSGMGGGAAQGGATAGGAATLPNGMKVSKDDIGRLLDALKKGGR